MPVLNPLVYTDGDRHSHKPCGKWAEIQKNPNSSYPGIELLCKISSPQAMAEWASFTQLSGKPIAKEHFDWYLSKGKGADFPEDDNLKLLLETDTKVQKLIASKIGARTRGTYTFHTRVEQSDYAADDQ